MCDKGALCIGKLEKKNKETFTYHKETVSIFAPIAVTHFFQLHVYGKLLNQSNCVLIFPHEYQIYIKQTASGHGFCE